MTPDDFMRQVEAQTRSPTHRFGRKERLENILQQIVGNADPRISAFDSNPVVRLASSCQGDSAFPFRKRLESIANHVD